MPDGFLVLDKKPGLTSFAALGEAKRAFGTGKVGHAGTLDKFASGVLVVLVGRYTRLSDYFMASDKRYRATFRFGIGTDTLDPEGSVVGTGPVPPEESMRAALPAFMGDIMQVPPEYSAIHVDGKRAYERVRSGERLEITPRKITIRSFELRAFDGSDVTFDIACSKGTYVRSLARDLAAACGTVAHVVELRRLESGPFTVENAVSAIDPSSLRALDAATAGRLGFSTATVPDSFLREFRNGFRFPSDRLDYGSGGVDAATTAAFGPDGFLGIVDASGKTLAYRVVIGGEA